MFIHVARNTLQRMSTRVQRILTVLMMLSLITSPIVYFL